MKASLRNDNHIFLFTVLGALLFVAAIGFMVANFLYVASPHFTVSGATLNGCSSLFFLYKAIKQDRARMRQNSF